MCYWRGLLYRRQKGRRIKQRTKLPNKFATKFQKLFIIGTKFQKLFTKFYKISKNFPKFRKLKFVEVTVGYIVSEIIAKVEKPHTIKERLVKPAMLICAEELLGEQAANILQKIPLSNDTVKRRQDEVAENLEEQLVEILKVSKFLLQIDKTKINNSVLLLAYVRYIDAMVILEEMLFINKLIDTESETIYAAVMTSCTIRGLLCQINCRLPRTVLVL